MCSDFISERSTDQKNTANRKRKRGLYHCCFFRYQLIPLPLSVIMGSRRTLGVEARMLKRCAAIPVSTSKARAQFGGLSGSPFGSGAVQSRGFFFSRRSQEFRAEYIRFLGEVGISSRSQQEYASLATNTCSRQQTSLLVSTQIGSCPQANG